MAGHAGPLGVRGVPNARWAASAKALQWLAIGCDGPETLDGLRPALEAAPADAVEPEALWALAEAHGHRLQLDYAHTGSPAHMDAVFRPRDDVRPGDVFWARPAPAAGSAESPHANNPLKAKLVRDLTPRLRQYLADSLHE
jgi:hypothetical protein